MTTRTLSVLALLLACDADSVPRAASTHPRAAPAAAPEGTEEQRTASLRAVQPVETRAGHLRFTDPALRDPLAAGVFGERLADASRPAGERLALAEALPRCGGAWARVSLERLAVERDAAVRAVLVGGLRRAEEEQALTGARAGLGDAAPEVRRAAAELAGWVPEVGTAMREGLQTALADPAAEVRAAAARAIGLTGNATAFDAVTRGLTDVEAQVRLESLRALQRLDEPRARALPAVVTLRQDPDERVRRAAAARAE
jgi:HEAT repeat protein